ncbi:family 16 glycosylhydrolase [Haloferula sp. BvORR071]|uniref:glycoside hydrolase family 16 protein n=1 Tax=Haloferula sp. BvORR071 TaxID=1396141 RepID=UPI0009DFC29A|nr:family 16 glycosylhydrolase [Haloferula sp. BvORR071]
MRSLPWLLLPLALNLGPVAMAEDHYLEFNQGQDRGGAEWVQAIAVSTPAPRSEVKGDVEVKFKAKGMVAAKALCWQQPTKEQPGEWGHDENLTPNGITLGDSGEGSFIFPAERFPNGPANVRIFAESKEGKKDIYELQLFNLGGVKWNQGIPKKDPPAAKGLKQVYADDFNGPLSISNDGRGSRYASHKPRFGDFSGWQFSDVLGEGKPFSQTGTWLKIAARKDDASPKGRSGIISSVNMDGKGFWAKPPAYLECRFTAQSAPGTWPAFWTITGLDQGSNGDELDIIEAYGGNGSGHPNHPGYSIVTHPWGQKGSDGKEKPHPNTVVKMMDLGGKSYWSTTFHTYAVSIGLDDTVYYFDDIEVFRHPSNPVSKENPHCFLINYAIGGISGWPIDLERYGNGSDMYVDYVRVYAKEAIPDHVLPLPGSAPEISTHGIGLNFSVAGDAGTELAPGDIAGVKGVSQTSWNNLPGASGRAAELKDSTGKAAEGLSATWEVPAGDQAWRSKTGREWGFNGGNLTMQRGYIQSGGKLAVKGIRYPRYEVHVYLNADDNGGSGRVSLQASGRKEDRYYKLGWHEGKFIESVGTTAETAAGGNLVVFRGQTAGEFSLDWDGNLSGGWTGVSGVQIVETP